MTGFGIIYVYFETKALSEEEMLSLDNQCPLVHRSSNRCSAQYCWETVGGEESHNLSCCQGDVD